MAFLRIATVDAVNSEVIREALHDAEIACHVNEVRPFHQIEYLRHQHRPMVDVEVEPEREDDARAILSRLELEAEEAVMAQAEAAPPSVDAEPIAAPPPPVVIEGRPRRDRKLTPLERGRRGTGTTGGHRELSSPSTERRSPRVALLFALLLPVAGPAYAAAWAVVGLSLALHVGGAVLAALGSWDGRLPDGVATAGLGLFALARIADIVLSPLLVHRDEQQGEQR